MMKTRARTQRSTHGRVAISDKTWQQNHHLVAYHDNREGPLIDVCHKCGHYGQTGVAGLEVKKCQGKKSRQATTLKRFRAGQRPCKLYRPLACFGKVPREWVATEADTGSKDPGTPQGAKGEPPLITVCEAPVHSWAELELDVFEKEVDGLAQMLVDQEKAQVFWVGFSSDEEDRDVPCW